ESLGRDDERAQLTKGKQLDDRPVLTSYVLGILDEPPGHRHRRDLAAGDFLSLGDGLPIHEREHGHIAERVDRVDQVAAHTYQAPVAGDQPRLALDRGLGLHVRRRQRRRKPPGGDVFMQVTEFQLDDVNLSRLPHAIEVGIVRIYSCGPTVYRFVHIGNLRTFMLPDLLRRSLEYLGYRTEQVMNITDVGHLTDDTFDRGEDKMLVSARLESKSPEEIA